MEFISEDVIETQSSAVKDRKLLMALYSFKIEQKWNDENLYLQIRFESKIFTIKYIFYCQYHTCHNIISEFGKRRKRQTEFQYVLLNATQLTLINYFFNHELTNYN